MTSRAQTLIRSQTTRIPQTQTDPKADITPKGPTQLVPEKPTEPSLVPTLKTPFDDFTTGAQRRAIAKPLSALNIPSDPTGSATAPSVPIPAADAKPSFREAYVQAAAQQLGFSPQVAAIATTELARRLGGDLIVNRGTKKQVLSYDDLKKTDTNGDGVEPYTFDPAALGVLKDANLAASLGMNSLQDLYAKQSQVLPSLRQAAQAGTDVDLDQQLQLFSDPATKEALSAYYDFARCTRDVGMGDHAAIDRSATAQVRLMNAIDALPPNAPLNRQLKQLQSEVESASANLQTGFDDRGQLPNEARALLNELNKPQFGPADDPNEVAKSIADIQQRALAKGAKPEQAQALADALKTAYTLKTNAPTKQADLDALRQTLGNQLKQAGPLAKPLAAGFDQLQKSAALSPTVESVSQNTTEAQAQEDAVELSNLFEALKNDAKAAGVKALPDGFEAVQSALEAIKNGNTWDGIISGGKAATSIIAGMVELLKDKPELAEPAKKMMEKMGAFFKGPTDIFGAFSNAKKAATGYDLEGNKISRAEQLRAGADLLLSDMPSLAGDAATLSGAEETAAMLSDAAPPLAVALIEVKAMIYVVEGAAKMKGDIAQYSLRNVFELGNGDDAQFKRALDGQLKNIADAPTTRADQARSTMLNLFNKQFPNEDTRDRFLAYASAHLPGGSDTVDAILNNKPIPAFSQKGQYGEGAATIDAANQLKTLATQFYSKETSEVRKRLNNEFFGRSGESYMTSDAEQLALKQRMHRDGY